MVSRCVERLLPPTSGSRPIDALPSHRITPLSNVDVRMTGGIDDRDPDWKSTRRSLLETVAKGAWRWMWRDVFHSLNLEGATSSTVAKYSCSAQIYRQDRNEIELAY